MSIQLLEEIHQEHLEWCGDDERKLENHALFYLALAMSFVKGLDGDKHPADKLAQMVFDIKRSDVEAARMLLGGVYKKEPISRELRFEVWDRDNFTCQHCGTRRDLSVDHIYPESKGGPTLLDNLQTLCRPCNSRKGSKV